MIKSGSEFLKLAKNFDNSLAGEDLVGFGLKKDISLIEKNCKNINLFFSEDDDVVPVSHAKKYKEKLKKSNIFTYKSKNGHFKISEFPEILNLLLPKKDRRKRVNSKKPGLVAIFGNRKYQKYNFFVESFRRLFCA